MKAPDAIATAIGRHLAARWHDPSPDDWPATFPLGRPSGPEHTGSLSALVADVRVLRDWAATYGLEVTSRTMRVSGTLQTIPTHVTVPDIDTSARIAGPPWRDRLNVSRSRGVRIAADFPTAPLPDVLRATHHLSDVDFDLLCRTGSYLRDHDVTGLTPRQVPVEGVHAKWIDNHMRGLRLLAGRDDFGFAGRPARVAFTYLDPEHRAAGRRHHDSITVGDNATPAYRPSIVLICENKDSALWFPPHPGAVTVEGAGKAGPSTIAAIDWIVQAQHLLYWGDIDAAGYEIVHMYRSAGVPVRTILMDPSTLTQWQTYASTTDTRGRDLAAQPTKRLRTLTAAEQAAYERVTDSDPTTPRRIEQERIPFQIASEALRAAVTGEPARR